MNKNLRVAFAATLATGLLFGASQSALAEPASAATDAQNLALLGPDRSPRAPQRAVTAPTRRATESIRREETVVAPPAIVTETFVYKKSDCRTLTNAPMDIWGRQARSSTGPAVYVFDEDRVVAWAHDDAYRTNRLGAMGADREYLNSDSCERLGVWANGRIAGTSPATIVSDMSTRLMTITCGKWTEPAPYNIAGIPVTRATGVDEYANYFYEIYAFERFGNTYAFATRVPYRARYNTERNIDLAYLITHIHPAVWVE